MKNLLIVVSLTLFIYTPLFGQHVQEKLDQLFGSINAFGEINGNVLIAENGVVVYKRSFGFSDVPNKVRNTDSTGFTLASVSKIFTSVAILQLRDKGKLKLDDQVVKYLKDFPYPDITIRNLISHTSGLPDYQLYEDQMTKNRDKIFSNKDVLPSLKSWKKPLTFEPGEKWQYSNTNFCLLALLVEKLSGLEFRKYLQKNIFDPAKMMDTYFQADSLHRSHKNMAKNYVHPFLYSFSIKNVDSLKQYRWILYNASGFVGQGGIISTNGDLLKFDNALYSGKILRPATLMEAFTPTVLKNGKNANADIGIGEASYGLGWFILNDTTDGRIVWHSGGRPGALGIFIRNISKKQTVIMFDNAFHKNLFANGINAMAVMNAHEPEFEKISLTRDYGSALVNKGADIAFCKLQQLRADSAHYYLSEDDNNELGLRLLYEASFDGHNELALEVLKLNTLLFPKGFNTYDSYGEALARMGKKVEAIFMYKKSIEINPENIGGKKALEELIKK